MASYPWLISLLFFLWKVSKSCVDFLIVLFMDCVHILVNVLFTESVLSWSMFSLRKVSYPGQCSLYGKCPILVTAPGQCSLYGKCPILVNVLFMESVQSWSMFSLRKVSNPGHGTKIARGWDWYKDIGYYFIKSISLF